MDTLVNQISGLPAILTPWAQVITPLLTLVIAIAAIRSSSAAVRSSTVSSDDWQAKARPYAKIMNLGDEAWDEPNLTTNLVLTNIGFSPFYISKIEWFWRPVNLKDVEAFKGFNELATIEYDRPYELWLGQEKVHGRTQQLVMPGKDFTARDTLDLIPIIRWFEEHEDLLKAEFKQQREFQLLPKLHMESVTGQITTTLANHGWSLGLAGLRERQKTRQEYHEKLARGEV